MWEQTSSGGGKGAAEGHLREVARSGTPEVFSELKLSLQKAGGVAITHISSLKEKKRKSKCVQFHLQLCTVDNCRSVGRIKHLLGKTIQYLFLLNWLLVDTHSMTYYENSKNVFLPF